MHQFQEGSQWLTAILSQLPSGANDSHNEQSSLGSGVGHVQHACDLGDVGGDGEMGGGGGGNGDENGHHAYTNGRLSAERQFCSETASQLLGAAKETHCPQAAPRGHVQHPSPACGVRGEEGDGVFGRGGSRVAMGGLEGPGTALVRLERIRGGSEASMLTPRTLFSSPRVDQPCKLSAMAVAAAASVASMVARTRTLAALSSTKTAAMGTERATDSEAQYELRSNESIEPAAT